MPLPVGPAVLDGASLFPVCELAAGAALLVGSCRTLLVPRWIGGMGERTVRRTLARLRYPAVHDLVLPDRRGVTQVDHVARGPFGFVVIETKALSGAVSGALADATWQQRVGRRRFPVRNPVRQNFRHVKAVQALVEGLGVPVHGLVVAAGDASFADALTPAVVPVAALGRALGELGRRGPQPVRIEEAWGRLLEARQASKELRAAHRAGIEGRRGPAQRLARAVALGAAPAGAAMMLMGALDLWF